MNPSTAYQMYQNRFFDYCNIYLIGLTGHNSSFICFEQWIMGEKSLKLNDEVSSFFVLRDLPYSFSEKGIKNLSSRRKKYVLWSEE